MTAEPPKPAPAGSRAAMLEEARKLGVDILYSEKGHFAAAASWRKMNYFLGIPAALIGAAAGATILADADPVVAGVLALIGAAITGLMTFLNPSERAQQHQRSGVAYGALRRVVRQFVQIDFQSLSDEKLRERLGEWTERVNTVQGDALPIPMRAHTTAYAEIARGSADYTDKELASATGAISAPQIGTS